ncbi:GON-4-like protein [Caenorhabditis elegans]|uniref:GON-4-like protein n=1 Tax=Caenorhabditis elegans TaxID=6239 RepID=A5JYS9_CAEEL|nr:GON-4-like protein [Caenorhabditis elegans]CAN86924.1 GON-4-like protein [Caenorhabditis elegans]|eukprot:NP_001122786.1 Uncharacterized protein CELE_K04D7.5 [Caenorhabditis elegans]
MEDTAEENNESIDDQPSTSTATDPNQTRETEKEKGDDEMFRLLQATDEILENKAKSMNLSSLNVRSILHHLIKYPSTIDVLLGIRENDDLPSVRNMRSRKKPDDSGASSTVNTPKKFGALRIEDRGPKSFLDLEYEEDDEYDDDYIEENDTSTRNKLNAGSEEDEENDDEEEIEDEGEDEDDEEQDELEEDGEHEITGSEACTSGQNDTMHALLFDETSEDVQNEEDYVLNMTLNDTRAESVAPIPTLDNVDDDGFYRDFVTGINRTEKDNDNLEVLDTEDDPDDEDYNVCADDGLNVEDWDETRQDKTTQIPRHELKALMIDTLLAEKEIPLNAFPEEAINGEEHRKSQKVKDAEVYERINTSISSSSESCSLLKDSLATFRPQELQQLNMQLEQHVQLLTQLVVTCHHDVNLSHVRNSSQLMMNELDDIRQQKIYPTVFDVRNLDAAIESCHDINAFDAVDESFLKYAENTEGYGGIALRPEAAVVLSRSNAIRYPALLPSRQPFFIETPIPFLSEEDLMLAVALLQFAHLPRRGEKEMIDRYTAIQQHCLPARSSYKIRTHLKSMRRSDKNPIHQIMQAAEKGVCKLVLPLKSWQESDTPICQWPPASQPGWYRRFQETFNVTEERKILRKHVSTMVLTPVKNKDRQDQEASEATFESGEEGEDDEFVNMGTAPDGRKIIMGREHIEDLVHQLIKQNEISPSKRRKNPTPMKLSTMIQLEEAEKRIADSQKNSCGGQTISALSNVSGDSNVDNNGTHEKELMPSTSSIDSLESINNQETSKFPRPLPMSDQPTLNTSCHITTTTCSVSYEDVDVGTLKKSYVEITASKYETNSNSCFSYPIPPTPGRRSPDDFDDYFMDLESNSLMWPQTPYAVTDENPQTPRGFSASESSEPIDFSSLGKATSLDTEEIVFQSTSCQRPMGYCSDFGEFSNSSSLPEEIPVPSHQRTPQESAIEDDSSMPGLDMVPLYEEDVEECIIEDIEEEEAPIKQGLVNSRPPLRFKKEVKAGITNLAPSRKRTRIEREAMGSVGLDDEQLHDKQKENIMRKVIEDVNQRLFMHTDTYQRFKEAITDENLTDFEKVTRTIIILANHPELLNLVLLNAPPEAVISDLQCDHNYQSYKVAIEMIMDIERYITAAKLKEPSLKGLFRYIQSFLEDKPNMTDEQATKRFYELFGQDRPLWKKLESRFWCLPYKARPRLENYEYIDLTGLETMSKREKRDWNSIPPRFETVDDIDQVMGSVYRASKNEPPSNLVVKCGEFCIRNDDETYTQLEITERVTLDQKR